jgi:tRNA pseudouridine55 synthase
MSMHVFDAADFGAQKSRGIKTLRRPVNGVLLLDKPSGMTSNQALQAVKHLFNARKAGHTGSLDPLASGLLPLCLGEATKMSGFLLDSDKEYKVECTFGVRTSTADAEGTVLETCRLPALTRARIDEIFSEFRGVITQIPPMYSALKFRGQRLYDLARDGIEVPREPRSITVYSLELTAYTNSKMVFKVRCSKGTYIRTLVEDLARAFGSCGHVSALRRLSVGPYKQMHQLEELEQRSSRDGGYTALDSLLLPVDSPVAHWPQVNLGTDAVWYFQRGQAVLVPGAPTDGWLRAYGDGHFLGLAEVLPDGRVTPRRLMNRD